MSLALSSVVGATQESRPQEGGGDCSVLGHVAEGASAPNVIVMRRGQGVTEMAPMR